MTQHPGPMLALHDIETIGCTPCHDGQGRATLAADAHGEVEHWDRPLLRGTLVLARCARCHPAAHAPRAPHLRRGAELMEHFACDGCHEMRSEPRRGRIGPELTFTADRVSPIWLLGWLKEPERLQARPRMGTFGFTDEQAASVTAYLRTFEGKSGIRELDFPPEDATDDELDAIYERGKRVFRMSRCLSCHAVEGKGGTIGPDLGKVGVKLSLSAVVARLEAPARFHPGTQMPRYRLPDADRMALAYYLLEETRDPDAEDWLDELEKRTGKARAMADAEVGRKLVQERGCLGCHRIATESASKPVGAALTRFGEKSVERLPFPDDWTGPRTRAAWTRAKLEKPRSMAPDLIMPSYRLDEAELESLLIATLALTEPAPPSMWAAPIDPPALDYPPGRVGELFRDLRCLTCHRWQGTGGTLAPDLSHVGSRVKREWLRDFLLTPYAVRPSLVERMPRLYLSDEEADSLTDFLMVAGQRDGIEEVASTPERVARGADEYATLRCRGCHMLGEKGGSIGPNLTETAKRLQPGWVAFQLLDPAAAGASEPRFDLDAERARDLAAFLTRPTTETP